MCLCMFLDERENMAEQEFLLSVSSCVWCLAEGQLQRPILKLRGPVWTCFTIAFQSFTMVSPPSDQPKERARSFPQGPHRHCWMCAGTPEPEGVRGSGCLHTTLGRGLKLAPQRVKTHSPHVRVPNGAWLGKTAQTDASPAVWLPKVFNLKWIFSSERRRPQPQRV